MLLDYIVSTLNFNEKDVNKSKEIAKKFAKDLCSENQNVILLSVYLIYNWVIEKLIKFYSKKENNFSKLTIKTKKEDYTFNFPLSKEELSKLIDVMNEEEVEGIFFDDYPAEINILLKKDIDIWTLGTFLSNNIKTRFDKMPVYVDRFLREFELLVDKLDIEISFMVVKYMLGIFALFFISAVMKQEKTYQFFNDFKNFLNDEIKRLKELKERM